MAWEEKFEEAIRAGASLSEAALIAGVTMSRVLAKAREDEGWLQAIRAAFLLNAERKFKQAEDLLQQMAENGNTKAAIALFEHRRREVEAARRGMLESAQATGIRIVPLGETIKPLKGQ